MRNGRNEFVASLLLALTYLAFISLGLPDSLLGSAWPVMRLEFGAALSFAGVISMLIAGGTITSSLFSDRLTRRFGTGLVTAGSVLLTAVALFGFSISTRIWMLCLWAIPYGLGAGAVDAALNNYAAVHFAARHMSWLHGCWGVGASISPYIMGVCLSSQQGWTGGYRSVSLLQIVLTAILFLGLPLWKRVGGDRGNAPGAQSAASKPLTLLQIFRLPGVAWLLLSFFAYCAMETTASLWASSYLAEHRGVDPELAATFSSLFYLGITAGRFVIGSMADRIGDKRLVRWGTVTVGVGVLLLLLPLPFNGPALTGLLIAGIGASPIYPAMIHLTPSTFGVERSQAIVGVQMATAYTGSTFMPPLFGLLAGSAGVGWYPVFLALFVALMLTASETLNRRMRSFAAR
jgi:fucose permease